MLTNATLSTPIDRRHPAHALRKRLLRASPYFPGKRGLDVEMILARLPLRQSDGFVIVEASDYRTDPSRSAHVLRRLSIAAGLVILTAAAVVVIKNSMVARPQQTVGLVAQMNAAAPDRAIYEWEGFCRVAPQPST